MRARSSLAVLPLALCLAAACGSQEASDGRVVLRYLAGPDFGGAAKELAQRFEQANPGIRVEAVEGPAATNTREDMYAASFMAKEDTYDVVLMDLPWLPKFAARGWLRPLDGLFSPQAREAFLPGDIAGSFYQGRLYRVPVQADGGVLYYRKDLLTDRGIGVPETFSQLRAAAKAFQKPPELWGFVFQGQQYEGLVCVFMELVWGNGGELIGPEGEVLIDRPEAVEALEWLVAAVREDKISPEGVLTYQEEEARRMFQEGNALFMRNWPYAWSLMQGEGSAVRGKVGIAPMVRGQGRSAAALGGWGFGISAFSKHPEEAWKLIEFLASEQAQKTAFERAGLIPTRKALFEDPEVLAAAPHFKELYEVLKNARPRPMLANYAQISDIVQVHVSAALSGQEEPREALSAAAKEIREILARQAS